MWPAGEQVQTASQALEHAGCPSVLVRGVQYSAACRLTTTPPGSSIGWVVAGARGCLSRSTDFLNFFSSYFSFSCSCCFVVCRPHPSGSVALAAPSLNIGEDTTPNRHGRAAWHTDNSVDLAPPSFSPNAEGEEGVSSDPRALLFPSCDSKFRVSA